MLYGLLLLLIVGGGYFAASETAFASVNPIRVRSRADDGERKAQKAQYVLDHFNKALSALLIGNNLMHIGTATLSTYLVTKQWGEGYTAYSTIVTTAVVFLVSEMIPKQFAKDKPEQTALFFADSLYWLMRLLTPVCALFDSISGVMLRLLKVKPAPTMTEDELDYIIDSLADSQEGGKQRSNLLRSALHFDDKTAGEVMTPIGAVVAIDISCDRQAVQDIIRANKFSRFPVYQRDPERIVGILDNRSWIKAHLAGGNVSVRKLMRKAMYAPAEMGIDELLDKMTQARTHMCVVTGENSTALGIITVEDILEELVGEIMDEDDVPASEMGGAAG